MAARRRERGAAALILLTCGPAVALEALGNASAPPTLTFAPTLSPTDTACGAEKYCCDFVEISGYGRFDKVRADAGGETCTNTCVHAGDGKCDDGREGSATGGCACGTDCDDCGPRADCESCCHSRCSFENAATETSLFFWKTLTRDYYVADGPPQCLGSGSLDYYKKLSSDDVASLCGYPSDDDDDDVASSLDNPELWVILSIPLSLAVGLLAALSPSYCKHRPCKHRPRGGVDLDSVPLPPAPPPRLEDRPASPPPSKGREVPPSAPPPSKGQELEDRLERQRAERVRSCGEGPGEAPTGPSSPRDKAAEFV